MLGLLRPVVAVASETHYASNYHVSSGRYVSGSVPAGLQMVDEDYLTLESSASATSTSSYNPLAYTLPGGTAYVSGVAGDLVSDDDVYMTCRSVQSAVSPQNLYAHQELTTIGGNPYFVQRLDAADSGGTSLSVSTDAAGRQLLGRFIYPLVGVTSIPSSIWTWSYRAWRDSDQVIAYDSVGSGDNGDGTSNITWTHVVGSGVNRFLVIGVSIKTVTVSVSNVTVGGQLATFLRSDVSGSEIRGEIWYLINPDPGLKTVVVALSGISKAAGGSVSYTGVSQTSPIDNHRGVPYTGGTPSISLTTVASNDWVFGNLAVSGTATVTAHGSGQVHRYYEVGTGGAGPARPGGADGDDLPITVPGSYTLSWNMSFYSDVVAQAVAFKTAPSPAAHIDVDIAVLRSDGTVRTVIATNVADSGALAPTPTTLTGTYLPPAYSVVDQSDYLEVDYYVEVSAATSGVMAYLRIDDDSLAATVQTKMADIMLPSQYAVEVEFAGSANLYDWTQLELTLESAWTTDSVTVTSQLYNYTAGRYQTDGNGFISYTSSSTPNSDERKTQVILTNPQHFRNDTGYWKVKMKGVKSTSTLFDLRADWVELKPTYYSEYSVSLEFMFSSIANETATGLNFTVVSEYDVAGVSVTVQAWNYSSAAYVDGGQGYLSYISSGVNQTKVVSIDAYQWFCALNGSAKIRVTSLLSTPTSFQQRINQVKLERFVPTLWLPLDWSTALLVTLPLLMVVFPLWFIWSKRRRNTKPLAKRKADAFSRQFGMSHEQLVGKKILLEVDPASDYNIALSGFVSEAEKSGEALFIVTNRNSALHSVFSAAKNANFLLLTSSINYPQRLSAMETLLPASDLSVLLDACAKTKEKQPNGTTNLLFDNLSDIILRCGLDKTYKFTRLLLEAIPSSEVTVLFVFVPTAHDQEVSSSIRSLFQTRLAYTKEGPRSENM